MQEDHRPIDACEDEHAILTRMLQDARLLCTSSDALLAGQFDHLLGRIAALMELTYPLAPPSLPNRGQQ
jgi:hypothetical protein